MAAQNPYASGSVTSSEGFLQNCQSNYNSHQSPFSEQEGIIYCNNVPQSASNPFIPNPNPALVGADNLFSPATCVTILPAVPLDTSHIQTHNTYSATDSLFLNEVDNNPEVDKSCDSQYRQTTFPEIIFDSNPLTKFEQTRVEEPLIPVIQVTDSVELPDKVCVDSVESLPEYGSDSSDIYMNPNYTDTMNSTASTTLLLAASIAAENQKATQLEKQQDAAEHASSLEVNSFYQNEAFSNASFTNLDLASYSHPVDTSSNGDDKRVVEINDGDHQVSWITGEDEPGPAPIVPLTAEIEQLFQQLKEHPPAEIVEVCVEELTEPVTYEPLSEDYSKEEYQTLMDSTESLHHYKMLKQGRMGMIKTGHATTMFNLHERNSFLNLTAASINSLSRACEQALHYLRMDMEFGSMMSLKDNLQHPEFIKAGDEVKLKIGPVLNSGHYLRNLLSMSVLVTLVLISLNATRNLQSSINQEGGVGIISLAIFYAAYMLGSLLSPVVVLWLGVRGSVIVGLILELLYVAGNLYPAMWVMAPISFAAGAALAILWNAMSTYIVMLARGEAEHKEATYNQVSDKYFGIFCLIYQCNLVVGNLIASLVLTVGNNGSQVLPLNLTDITNDTSSNVSSLWNLEHVLLSQDATTNIPSGLLDFHPDVNNTGSNLSSVSNPLSQTHYHLCGSEFCHHFVISKEDKVVSDSTKYLLFGIYMLMILAAILISAFLLESLSSHLFSSRAAPWQTIQRQMTSLFHFSCNTKFLLLFPLLFFSNMQFSFACSEITMAFVTCPAGVWLVGYTMICYGVCCSASSYITPALVPRLGRLVFVVLATAVNLGVLFFMRFWHPHPDLITPLFFITGLWGFADGIWNVNANSLMGSVFADHYEEAFTGLRVAQGLGGALSMAYSPFFCMAFKLYVMMVTVFIVLLGYIAAEVIIRREQHSKIAKLNALMEDKEI